MLLESLVLAVLTTLGFYLIYKKLPARVRRFMEKYNLATDALALTGTYLLLGSTLTALTAGAMAGILTSILLYMANHEEDFMFVWDLRDFVKEQINKAKSAALAYGKQYRENKLGTYEILATA